MFVELILYQFLFMSMIVSEDKCIVITGASSGIGYSLGMLCGARKAKVALLARRADRLHELAQKVEDAGGIALPITCDVTNSKQVELSLDTVINEFGTIDVLINNAGRGYTASVEDTTDEDIRSMFELNAFSLWYTSRKVLPIMKEKNSGVIVTVSSVAGKMGFPFNSAYVAAKHAAVGFHAALTAELAGTNVRSIVVCPDGVQTEWPHVTENAPIGELFSRGIRNSKEVAKERNIPLAPLSTMMTADNVAEIIMNSIEDNNSPLDVFTHTGSYERSIVAAENRLQYREEMLPLYIGMQKAYKKQ